MTTAQGKVGLAKCDFAKSWSNLSDGNIHILLKLRWKHPSTRQRSHTGKHSSVDTTSQDASLENISKKLENYWARFIVEVHWGMI